METKDIIIAIVLWGIPIIAICSYEAYRLVKGYTSLTLFELIGGFLAICFFAPIIAVIAVMVLADNLIIKKQTS